MGSWNTSRARLRPDLSAPRWSLGCVWSLCATLFNAARKRCAHGEPLALWRATFSPPEAPMAVLRTLAGPLSVTLVLACAAPAFAHSTSSGVGNGGHPVSASTVNGAASESGQSSQGSEGSSAGSGNSSAGSADSSAASEGTSGGSTEASEGTSDSSSSSEQQDPPPAETPDDDSSNTAELIIASTVLGTVTAATVGSVLLTIFAVNELSAELYLRSNGHALRHHIERGAGNALDDLAHLCGVPTSEYARFAEATRQARRTLIVHLEDPRSID